MARKTSRNRGRKATVRQALESLEILDETPFEGCSDKAAEFKVMKKEYFRRVLTCHPDKGGDPAVFREVQTSFELLRDLAQQGGSWTFASCVKKHEAKKTNESIKDQFSSHEFDMADYDTNFDNSETASWEYYQEAAKEVVPTYRIELAKSGRSKCCQTGKKAKRCQIPLQEVAVPVMNESDDDESALMELKKRKAEIIEKGEVRIGWMDDQSGSYGRWVHLRCWRVPYRVWVGVPDPESCTDHEQFKDALFRMNDVVLSGFADLPGDDQHHVACYVMDKQNWARKTKTKLSAAAPTYAPPPTNESASTSAVSKLSATATTFLSLSMSNNGYKPAIGAAAMLTSSTALVPVPMQQSEALHAVQKKKKEKFVIPVPGKNGTQPNAFQGKRFVLTGVFPEVGGGTGLKLGKDKVRSIIESFGGRVTTAVSGKTDVLVVGKEPGMSKVSNARTRSNVILSSLYELADGLFRGHKCLEEMPVWSKDEPMKIRSFSAGYKLKTGYNILAIQASNAELAFAKGTVSKKKRNVMELEGEEPAKGKRKGETKKTRMLPGDGGTAQHPDSAFQVVEKPKAFSSMTVVELRRALKALGLPVGGLKAQLIFRLEHAASE